jgi:peptidyl-prolyl cis-trans isomerase SurA
MRPAAVLAALGIAVAVGGASAERLGDGIAAQVGSEIVLISDVRQAAQPTEARARAQGATDADIRQLYFGILEQMIERALIRQVVKRAEIGASDAEVDEAIAAIARENGLAPEKLRASVEAQGMPYAAYRERIRGEIEHAKVVNDVVASRVRVEESEVRELYDREIAKQPEGGEEFFLRLIVVTPKGEAPDARAAACASVGAAKARIDAGESFEAVAREVSEANPERGGAQGWVHDQELASWMRPAVTALEAGGVSERIEAGFGCALVQLVERRSFVPLPYEQAKERLYQHLREERMAEQYAKFVNQLREQTYIERKGPFADVEVRAPRADDEDAEPGF